VHLQSEQDLQATLESLRTALADRYKIERELGAGGMATVYLAQDLKHDRKVAIKVLKPELAAVLGAERFVVEIKTTAALQHPHILPLFDSGTAGNFLFYVMPYVVGETLRDRLNRETQFGIDEALRIACDVLDALDYAHRHGVIHRDIKPENILLHDGRPMVADFGIALALSAAAGGRMTETGLSLGTPHYMSPEQATAEKEITGRSDVYSLASVLYEMLSGEPPHMGKSAQQIIMKIIAEPVKAVTELRKSVPQHVAEALAQALEKLPADRFATAAEFSAALQGKVAGRTTARAAATTSRSDVWRKVAVGTGVIALVLAVVTGWALNREPERQMMQVNVAFPRNEGIRSATTRRFDISRDGKRIVYIGPDSVGTQLWVREMSALNARPIPGTRDALAPFFSPDGQNIGFLTGPPSDVRVVPVAGGAVTTLAAAVGAQWGGAWGDDGFIYFVHRTSSIARVPSAGGAVEIVSLLDSARGEAEHDWPQPIPGGRWILAQGWHNSMADADIVIIDTETKQSRTISQGLYARYLRSGHLLIVSFAGSLTVVPFDKRTGTLTGAPVRVAESVQVDGTSGSAQFAASETGTLIYAPGGGSGSDRIVWVDRAGRDTPVDSGWQGQFGTANLSPDNSRLAVTVVGSEGEQIWVKEMPRGPLSRLTFGSSSSYRPAWSPDGRRIYYSRSSPTGRAIWSQRADGSAPAESLYADRRAVDEVIITPDGRTAVMRLGSGGTATRDIIGLRIGVDSIAKPLVAGQADEYAATVSPDGKWMAYSSLESGRSEIYVRQFADPGAGRVQVSVDGGEEPLFSRAGRELFYRTGRGDMLVATYDGSTNFVVRDRQLLFNRASFNSDGYHRAYDVSRDGRRFLMVNRAISDLSELILVLNWDAAGRP
jgi:Tol biopolymer transport system component